MLMARERVLSLFHQARCTMQLAATSCPVDMEGEDMPASDSEVLRGTIDGRARVWRESQG